MFRTSHRYYPHMPLHAGDVFAGYTIQRLLGAGGMGEVYLAQHPRLPRHDALKILPASLTRDTQYRERFNREADIAASLWHPHIVSLHDRGEADGQLWIAMDYVEGTDASRLLRERHRSGLPVHEATEIISAIADALDYAHARHLLHRDVKPANILLTLPGAGKRRIFLADFGVARRTDEVSGLTATNLTVGSMPYSAPEQLMGLPLDGRADQYALAATTYQLLTGRSPFHATNPAVVISKHLSEPPPRLSDARPELGYLDDVIAKALAKEPEARFALCGDFARALTQGSVPNPGGHNPPTTPAQSVHLPPPPQHNQQSSASLPWWATGTSEPVPTASPPPAWSPAAAEPFPTTTVAASIAATPASSKKPDRTRILIPAVLAVLLVGALVFAISQFARPTPVASTTPEWQPYVDAAKEFVVTWTGISYPTVDDDIQKVLQSSTSEFNNVFQRKALDIKATLIISRASNKGTVNAAAIESFKPGEADVMISAVVETTKPNEPASTENLLRVVTVVKDDDKYKVSTMTDG